MSQILHQQLVQLRGKATVWLDTGYAGGLIPRYGICNNLDLAEDDQVLLADLLASWPDGAGNMDYPVPHLRCLSAGA